ncbi:hypothetical protein MMSR116_02700 [Methylobacterium mesophilicum SR1.6/6]|uniref:Uncharacterized protein n=1 Tax=Methylobacterium mesophilicum SR1.6/6 TaxID=908290 RepID=A0A6B9FEZ0_9HYPH|nr:hypothetical protein [Methylobacterium mesophilicum]QGY00929.1 hypothetical protein MMSR116_02700 [Methylobacterium mesophilicum SR1.6/6]
MSDAPKLTLKFDNKKPLEVADLTSSLNATVRQYQKYAVSFDDVNARSEAELYGTELRRGSYITELAPYVQELGAVVKSVAPYAEDSKKVIGFADYLKTGFDALLGGKKPPEDVSTKDLKDFKQILEPTAKEAGAVLMFQATDGATQNITVNVNSQEANAIQNQAVRQIEIMKEPEQRRFNKRLMYWCTATKGRPNKTSGKVIIETISKKPLPVFIDDPEIKQKMVAGRGNPFLVGFIVDVELLLVRGEVRGYSVLALHGTLEDDEDAGDGDAEEK